MNKSSKERRGMVYASLEHSKKLAWLFPDAEWWHIKQGKEGKFTGLANDGVVKAYLRNSLDCMEDGLDWSYPAITTDMALEILPYLISYKKRNYKLRIDKLEENLYDVYYHNSDGYKPCKINPVLLRNALCLMIEYLVKEGIIKHGNT